ncbi:HlyD family secretion protein [Parathalassolituus penaei]|uniref:HlyD family secretion protein n=1 Tax=Parathalassolituus penaei TaxID=2997323 RepID=A0A9X3EEH3_9GAMM|nr:HlyD family secretion protein [Parathalassolituus penaei]MCY0966087.1 HlyD family secretion protein [Parathalassolituus penaei]
MTPDIHFNRWMRRATVLFLLILAYILFLDVKLPMTSYAMVQRPVVTVAPRVSGTVLEVNVHNNQAVKAGDVLFRIDDRDYQLALEHAELAMIEAGQGNEALQADLAHAEAALNEAEVQQQEAEREYRRMESLHERQVVSQQDLDRASSSVQAAQARRQAARESRNSVAVKLGESGARNLQIRLAANQLAQAQLNLDRTVVRAAEDGVISNLQLQVGAQAVVGQPLLSLVATDDARIAADFREKSLANIADGAEAWVVFDALPGQLFSAELDSRDMGVAAGQLLANGQLAKPDDSDRWVRDAQRVRVYLDAEPDHGLPLSLVSGSRATVMLLSSHGALLDTLGKWQMQLISLLRYVY